MNIITIIDTYSSFISKVIDLTESVIDDITLNSESRTEVFDTYSQLEIDNYNDNLKYDKWFKEASDRYDNISYLDSSTLPDNFWNE